MNTDRGIDSTDLAYFFQHSRFGLLLLLQLLHVDHHQTFWPARIRIKCGLNLEGAGRAGGIWLWPWPAPYGACSC